MDEVRVGKAKAFDKEHKNEHAGYEYTKHKVVPRSVGRQCVVSVYHVPPGKAAYPYHHHSMNEEVFYILVGRGLLRTPAGERTVEAGDFLFFPAGAQGAHKLTNTSAQETLTYIDFDTANPVDVAVYPDSGKIGVWGQGVNKVFRQDSAVDYYDGE